MSRPMYAMPAYEMTAEDRAEEAAERREEALADAIEQRQMHARFGAEIDEILGTSDRNSDGNTHKAADMASVLLSSQAAFDAEAVRFFQRLRDEVNTRLRAEAEAEYDKGESA